MGKNKDVKIGCGFVQFAETANAKAALAEMNLKDIMERQVVVDWAVAKNMYTAEKKSTGEPGDESEKKEEFTENQKKGNETAGKKGEKKATKVGKVEKKKKGDKDDMEEGEEDED